MNNAWIPPNAWGYYQHPHVYVPPPYGPAQRPWDQYQSGWNRPAPETPRPTTAGYQSAKYPNLNPVLASDTTLVRYDVSKKPRENILASTYYSNRNSIAMSTSPRQIRLISKEFPWTIDIMALSPITCELVWDALYAGLQEPIADSEWGIVIGDEERRKKIEEAAKKRTEGGNDKRLRRIDWLGETVMFKGLDKDEEFEKLRLLPGNQACPDTWMVKFGKP